MEYNNSSNNNNRNNGSKNNTTTNNNLNNKEIKVNNVEIKDLKFNFEIKPENTSANSSNSSDSEILSLNDNIENYEENDDNKSKNIIKNFNNNNNIIENNSNYLNQNNSNKNGNIRQSSNNFRDNLNSKRENLRNFPNNAKERVNNARKRMNDANSAIKNFHSNKDGIKNNIKDQAKNVAHNVLDKEKEGLKNSIENSKPVQTAKNLKNAYEKGKKAGKAAKKAAKVGAKATKGLIDFLISTSPWSFIVIGVLILLFLVLIIILTSAPGIISINDDNDSSSTTEVDFTTAGYSEKDSKTLTKLNNLYKKYPNSNAPLAMAAIIYPYYETLQNKSTTYYINTEDKNWDADKIYKDSFSEEEDDSEYIDESDNSDESDDTEECEGDDCKAEDIDDIYLELYRKFSYRRKFKSLLKKSSSMNKEEFLEYIKTDYIPKNRGYKKILKFVDEDNKDKYIEAVISDLSGLEEQFENYFYANINCSSSEQSISYSILNIIEGEAVIVLKDTSMALNTRSAINNASTLYGTDDLTLSLKRYVMGVAYNEVGLEAVRNEAIAKTIMIAAKSYVLGRTAPGGPSYSIGMGYIYDKKDGKTVFYLRANTNDQDFCDIYEGCLDGSRYSKSNIKHDNRNEAIQNRKPAMSAQDIANLEKWYDETAGEFVYNDKAKAFAGWQLNVHSGSCVSGHCLSQQEVIKKGNSGQDYKTILFGEAAYSDSRYVLYNVETQNLSAVSVSCTANTSSCGISDGDFIYYSQKTDTYGNETFCHSTEGSTIKQSGCGITAMAMVIANLKDKAITPVQTNEEAYEGSHCGSYGTSASYFQAAASKYGLTLESRTKSNNTDISKEANKIIDTIKKGGLVIVNVNSLWLNGNSGHYIVIKGLDDNGNLIIADPYADSLESAPRNHISASKIIQDYVNNNFGWYLFTSDKSSGIAEQYCKETTTDGEGTAVSSGNWKVASKYDFNKVKKIGKQCPYTCYSTVMSYGAYMNKNLRGFNKCRKWGLNSRTFGATKHYYSNKSDMFKAIVKSLDKGRVVALHGRSSVSEHWVLVVGYNKNYNQSTAGNMSVNDFLTVDPYSASEKLLSKSLSGGLCPRNGRDACNHALIWE